jgi:hypothetical protein
MKLWRNVTIDRAGRVVLKLGGDEFGRRFGRMVPADPGLRVHFKLLQRRANALSVRHAYILITANERGERDGFGSGKCRIPTGAMLHGFDSFAVCILIFIGGSLANKLLASRPDAGPWLSLAKSSAETAPARPNCPASRPCHSPAMTPRWDQ